MEDDLLDGTQSDYWCMRSLMMMMMMMMILLIVCVAELIRLETQNTTYWEVDGPVAGD